ncbi:MAG: 16S rRNA (guanine(966)-N(2))-methyltransferase RsmD [Desulfobacteraceae bacterium]|nr:16S rRNA (guanine(966)-N(2))-methyltransferase RsmD [Desulfobacteraceae bacterium]
MRIIAGAFRGRGLRTPKDEKIRPTTDKVREAIFSMIASYVPEARVLDLFAGTGAMGLEALSRGAEVAFFVDRSAEAARLIRENITICGALDRARVIREDALSAVRRLASKGERFDIVFADPPYGKGLIDDILEIIETVAAPKALFVAEQHAKDEPPRPSDVWEKYRERRYGDTLIELFLREAAE